MYYLRSRIDENVRASTKGPQPLCSYAGVLTKKSVARGKQYVRVFVHTV